MDEQVKPLKRRYNSTRRTQQAEETRRRIRESASDLFLTRGYGATTIEAIAADAGVAVETVYASFRNKHTILAQVFDVAVTGDDRPVALLDRAAPQELRRTASQEQQIEQFAGEIRKIQERVGPLMEVMRLAAATEDEIATLLAERLDQRLTGMKFFVDALLTNGPLRVGLDRDGAADIVWMLSSAEVHRLLTGERAWSGERYEAWLAESLVGLLLPPRVS